MKLILMREINSESVINKKYTVRLTEDDFGTKIWMCNCPSFLFAKIPGSVCKHIQKVQKLLKVKKEIEK